MNNNLVLFFDGCHKIYYAKRSDQPTIDTMRGYGYEVIDGNFSRNLNELWRNSCGLRFVEPADLDFTQPHVNQGEIGGLRGFRTRLHNYFKEVA